jgi:hypothetical protein
MALVTIQSDSVTADVVRGVIVRPLVGIWTADLTIDQPNGLGFAAGAKVTIESQDGFSLKGVVAPGRSGDFIDTVHVRVLGGAGGLPKTVQARNYVQPGAFVNDVLKGLCGDSGETLSNTVAPALLTTNLSAWSVKAEPMSYALLTLLGWVSASLNWRILSDGTLWVGTESWPSASVTYDLLSHDPREAAYELGLQSPALEPGTTVDGIGKISRAEISISAEAIRARVWTPTDDPDRSTNADLDALISQKTSHVDYYALYVFQVVSQSADLSTVDISPVGDRNKALLGGMQRVTARYLTGIQVQVAPGSTCLLGWDGGNPEGPFALILSGDSALKIQLGGAHPLPLWDSFESALNTFINMFSGASPIVVVATGIPSPALVSAAQTIQALLTSHALESQIVSNG